MAFYLPDSQPQSCEYDLIFNHATAFFKAFCCAIKKKIYIYKIKTSDFYWGEKAAGPPSECLCGGGGEVCLVEKTMLVMAL